VGFVVTGWLLPLQPIVNASKRVDDRIARPEEKPMIRGIVTPPGPRHYFLTIHEIDFWHYPIRSDAAPSSKGCSTAKRIPQSGF
jgi:hypothetical protein